MGSLVKKINGVNYTVTWKEAESVDSCSSRLYKFFTLQPFTAEKEIVDEMCKAVYDQYFHSNQYGGFFVSPSDYASKGREHGYITSNFCHWLIENKKGIVIESPLFVNMTHGKTDKSSLCQMFTWIPPFLVENGCVVEQTGGVHNVPEKYKESYNTTSVSPKIPFDKLVHPALAKVKHFAKAKAKWDEDKKEIFARLAQPPVWKARKKA